MHADLADRRRWFDRAVGCGLWAAVDVLERDPGRSVVVLEAASVGFGASTRNAGMLDQSLTHGPENGAARWPGEIDMLVRFGRENFDEIITLLDRYCIEVDLRRVAALDVATHEWQLDELVATSAAERASGDDSEMLDAAATQARVASPTYIGAMLRRNHYALVDPAQLVWGLTALVERLGGTVCEHSAVIGIESDGRLLIVSTADGRVAAERVVLATNALRAPGRVGRTVRRRVIPIYDHVLMTEPLTREQQASVGWNDWDGVDDADFQFHYSRRTADGRVLWGGDDAMTTRFTCARGTEYRGRLARAAGYTGLGIAASRFGARTALDLVDGLATERTELAMVREPPMAFPPEPARYAVVNATRRATRRCEENEGRPGPWLKLLDRFGLGLKT